ncbi:MAG: response regulator [candidate division WOR-3 bacterium]
MRNRVLIADDAKFMRKLLAKILEEGGYEVSGEAETGSEAIALYKRLKPDVVTMDLVMPDMSGIDAIKEIMASDPKARIVVVSAMGQQSLVSEAMSSGAKDFIVKPFHPSVVLEVIGRVLRESA